VRMEAWGDEGLVTFRSWGREEEEGYERTSLGSPCLAKTRALAWV